MHSTVEYPQLLDEIAQAKALVVMTGKFDKTLGLQTELNHQGVSTRVLNASPDIMNRYSEPRTDSARRVAVHKARFGQKTHQEISPELQLHEVVYAGLDTVFHNGKPWHKLENPTPKDIEKAKKDLTDVLSWRGSDQHRTFGWALAAALVNGQDFTVDTCVLMKSRSIDPDLVHQAVEEAADSGLITKFNTRIPLIEFLQANDAIEQIAVNGQWSRSDASDRNFLAKIQQGILETSPLPLMNLRSGRMHQ